MGENGVWSVGSYGNGGVLVRTSLIYPVPYSDTEPDLKGELGRIVRQNSLQYNKTTKLYEGSRGIFPKTLTDDIASARIFSRNMLDGSFESTPETHFERFLGPDGLIVGDHSGVGIETFEIGVMGIEDLVGWTKAHYSGDLIPPTELTVISYFCHGSGHPAQEERPPKQAQLV